MTIRKKIAPLFLVCFVALMFSNCGKKAADADSTDDADSSVDVSTSAVTAVGGAMDEESGGGFSMNSRSKATSVAEWMQSLLSPVIAWAADCSGRAKSQSCTAGVRSVTYSCSIGAASLSGTVALTYSDAGCAMSTNGYNVTRTVDTAITGRRGGSIKNKSTGVTDFQGNSYGAGVKMTKTAAGLDMDILGVEKILTKDSKTVFDISKKSTSTLKITGGLDRASRTIASGTLEIYHNVAKFKATHTFSNVKWTSAGCCYPTSGSMTIAYSNTSDAGTMTFGPGCGAYSLVVGSAAAKTGTMTECE